VLWATVIDALPESAEKIRFLAVLLLLGHPFAYIWAVYAMGLWTLLVYGMRVLRFRRRL
jgi:hypothetical protein